MDQVSIETRIQERLLEWEGWIAKFMEMNEANPASEYKPIPNAAELLNDYYWRLALNFLKPLLEFSDGESEHNLHYYKIISSSELTVMAVMPFCFTENSDKEQLKQLNAEFAWFVSISILLNWKVDNVEVLEYEQLDKVCSYNEIIDLDENNEPVYYTLNFMDEHIEWLKDINTAAPLPILSNSQTWRMLFFAAKGLDT